MFWKFNKSFGVMLDCQVFTHKFCSPWWVDDQVAAERAASTWKCFKKVIAYWEELCNSLRPGVKSHEPFANHYKDLHLSMKLQFFAFFASTLKSHLAVFQTSDHTVRFTRHDLEKIINQLLCLFSEEML